MKKLIRTHAYIAAAILVTSCSQQQSYESEASTAQDLAPIEIPSSSLSDENLKKEEEAQTKEAHVIPTEDQTAKIKNNHKLIKTGEICFESKSPEQTRAYILDIMHKYQGYTYSDRIYENSNRKFEEIIIKVPSLYFDSLLNNISKGIGKLDSKNIRTSDVTEEFLDLTERLKTKKQLINQFYTILEKAKTIEEILQVETEISYIRSDTESMEGRLRFLRNQTSFSTLNITFYQDLPEVFVREQFGMTKKLKEGFNNGWEGLLVVTIIFTNIWPLILLIATGFLIWRMRKPTKDKK